MNGKNIQWRKSSYSGDGGNGGGECVEVAWLANDRIMVRDSKNPDAGTVTATPAWLRTLVR